MSNHEKPKWRAPSWLLALYYLAILLLVIYLHARSGLATPKFIYQGF